MSGRPSLAMLSAAPDVPESDSVDNAAGGADIYSLNVNTVFLYALEDDGTLDTASEVWKTALETAKKDGHAVACLRCLYSVENAAINLDATQEHRVCFNTFELDDRVPVEADDLWILPGPQWNRFKATVLEAAKPVRDRSTLRGLAKTLMAQATAAVADSRDGTYTVSDWAVAKLKELRAAAAGGSGAPNRNKSPVRPQPAKTPTAVGQLRADHSPRQEQAQQQPRVNGTRAAAAPDPMQQQPRVNGTRAAAAPDPTVATAEEEEVSTRWTGTVERPPLSRMAGSLRRTSSGRLALFYDKDADTAHTIFKIRTERVQDWKSFRDGIATALAIKGDVEKRREMVTIALKWVARHELLLEDPDTDFGDPDSSCYDLSPRHDLYDLFFLKYRHSSTSDPVYFNSYLDIPPKSDAELQVILAQIDVLAAVEKGELEDAEEVWKKFKDVRSTFVVVQDPKGTTASLSTVGLQRGTVVQDEKKKYYVAAGASPTALLTGTPTSDLTSNALAYRMGVAPVYTNDKAVQAFLLSHLNCFKPKPGHTLTPAWQEAATRGYIPALHLMEPSVPEVPVASRMPESVDYMNVKAAILNYNRFASACYGRNDRLTAQLLDFEQTMDQVLLDSSRRAVFIEAFSITVTDFNRDLEHTVTHCLDALPASASIIDKTRALQELQLPEFLTTFRMNLANATQRQQQDLLTKTSSLSSLPSNAGRGAKKAKAPRSVSFGKAPGQLTVETTVTANDEDNANTAEPAFKRQSMKGMMKGPQKQQTQDQWQRQQQQRQQLQFMRQLQQTTAATLKQVQASASALTTAEARRVALLQHKAAEGADVTGFGRVIDASKLGKKFAEHKPTTDKVCVFFQKGFCNRYGSCPNIHQKPDGK